MRFKTFASNKTYLKTLLKSKNIFNKEFCLNLFLFLSLKVVCGGELTGLNGSFSSPNYPENYDSRLRCNWTITVPPEYNIRLNFIDLHTESCDDYVLIFDGKSTNSTSIATFCGNLNSMSTTYVTSSSNVMTVKFFTDGSINFRGFLAFYSVVKPRKSPLK
jgi:deleted-in-malignant-brain-tumors protein 1